MTEIRAILFDLGGVLVRLNGRPLADQWLPQPIAEADFWTQWLSMPCLEAYHCGQLDCQDFARQVIGHWQLDCSPEAMLQWFRRWPDRLLPGALAVVQAVKPGISKAIFSNINTAHWPLVRELGLLPLFDHALGSHLCGAAKPDPAFYRLACARLDCRPEQVLLLDDTLVNVQSAHALGMQAVQVQGPDQARAALLARGLLMP